jgi:HAAS domain-containing protein
MTDALISEYLGRLDAAAWPLSPTRRSELTAEVREHIERALLEAGSRDETTVRNVLDRLGRPEDIVAAEAEAPSASAQPPTWDAVSHAATSWMAQAASRGWGGLEIAAVLLLTLGALLLWWVGPIVGIVVAWFSERWTRAEKRVATVTVLGLGLVQLVVLAVLFAGAFSSFPGFGSGGFSPFSPSGFGMMGLAALLSAVLPLVAGLGVGVYLAIALQRRPG